MIVHINLYVVHNACAAMLIETDFWRSPRPQRHAIKQSNDLAKLAAWSEAPPPEGVRVLVHRPRLSVDPPLFNAYVARPVSRREMQQHPKALAAEAKEAKDAFSNKKNKIKKLISKTN